MVKSLINWSIFLFFAHLAFSASADTIVLKDGKTIVGDILQETDDAIVVSKHDGGFIYSISHDRVKRIRRSTPEEIEVEKAKWYPVKTAVSNTQGTAGSAAAPAATSGKDREDATREYQLKRYEEEVLAAQKARGRIKIKFSKGRFGVVDAFINNKVTAALYVDTGASLVIISSDLASRLGIDEKQARSKGRMTVILANGTAASVTPVTLDSIKVGSSIIKNVKAAISDSPPDPDVDGLLGMSFLKYFHVRLDSSENCLVLEKY